MDALVIRTYLARWAAPSALATLCTALLGACAHSGAAEATAETPAGQQESVTFDWSSDRMDPTRGEISVVAPNGQQYAGTYFEITEDVETQNLGPLWDDWAFGWTDWDGGEDFATVYSGKVAATLRGSEGDSMRCRFTLDKPDQGLRGGATGDCQSKGGTTIENAVLPPE